MGRDHNATSYSTETEESWRDVPGYRTAEIITLRAIALKPSSGSHRNSGLSAEIITLRAIALKLHRRRAQVASDRQQRS